MILDEAGLFSWRRWAHVGQPIDLTGILWPALGYPALLDASTAKLELTVLLCIPGVAVPSSDQVIGKLQPVLDPTANPLEMTAISVDRVSLSDVSEIGRWAPWIVAHVPSVLRVVFSFATPTATRRTNLFDLEVYCDGRSFRKPGAVATRKTRMEMRVALATDVHVSSRWDEFETGFERLFKSVSPKPDDPSTLSPGEALSREVVLNTFVNPNRNLGWFTKVMNDMAARDEIDAVIVSGDLVDFKYRRARKRSSASYDDTEWKLLQNILLGLTKHGPRLSVPMFTSTGNHDYRLYPYRLHTYGIQHAGIPDEISELYSRHTGEWGALKYIPSDADAMRVNSGVDHSLNYYYRDFNPCVDFELSLGGVSFVVLDSGPDASTNLEHLISRRVMRFLNRAPKISEPSSDGFNDDQIKFLARRNRRSDGKSAVVVTHAPLINPPQDFLLAPGESSHELLTLPKAGDRDSLRFEQYLADRHLNHSSLIRNQLPVFEALRGHKGAALFFAGHTHTRAEMFLDKDSGRVTLREYSTRTEVPRATRSGALLFHTPALAHVQSKDARIGNPSYRLIRIDEGIVQEVVLAPVLERPLDEWVYEWACTREGEGVERVDFLFSRRLETDSTLDIRRRLILRFTGIGVEKVIISVPDPSIVVTSRINLAGQSNAYASWVIRGDAPFQVKLEKRPRGTRLSFLYETIRGDRDPGSGLRWHFRSYAL